MNERKSEVSEPDHTLKEQFKIQKTLFFLLLMVLLISLSRLKSVAPYCSLLSADFCILPNLNHKPWGFIQALFFLAKINCMNVRKKHKRALVLVDKKLNVTIMQDGNIHDANSSTDAHVLHSDVFWCLPQFETAHVALCLQPPPGKCWVLASC